MKTNRLFLLLAATALALSSLACGTVHIDFDTEIVHGSGDIVSETYEVSGFDRLSLSGAGQLEIVQDGREYATVETDDNILEYVDVEVRGDTLYIETVARTPITIDWTRMRVTLHVRDLERIEASGADPRHLS